MPRCATWYRSPAVNREDCLRLATAIAKAQLSSREVAELCSAFSQSSQKVRERLLEDPRLFLRARERTSTSHRTSARSA